MSSLLVSWVKVDVSHAGLASIYHKLEKGSPSRSLVRYSGDPTTTTTDDDDDDYDNVDHDDDDLHGWCCMNE